jgi:prolyl-tRNA synthetase
MKCVMFSTDQALILAVLRGDLTVNEIKLVHLAGVHHLHHATAEEIRNVGSEPGFISPVGMKGKMRIIGDTSLRTVRNFYGGANKLHRDALNMNIDRDFSLDAEGDIAMAENGFQTEDGKSRLMEKRGIEVGNIFQLGYHYTTLMKGATFVDEDGREKPYYMGCYGIGIGRTMAAIVEKHHDDKGIVWLDAIAPFDVHFIDLTTRHTPRVTNALMARLKQSGLDVLWDDREGVSAGVKFADADLIGIPWRVVVSEKTGEKVEVKRRSEKGTRLMTVTLLVRKIDSSNSSH